MFTFGGEPQTYSFNFFHADTVPNSEIAVLCPALECEWVCFQNDPSSTGNLTVGSYRLPIVGAGIVLEPGEVTPFIPVKNTALFWHKESDSTTYLNYYFIGNRAPLPKPVILIEISNSPLLLEDRSRILIYD